MKKVALWIRVSTSEQDTTNQKIALEEFCERRNLEITKIYDLTGISAYRNQHEKILREVQKDGRANQFDTLLVWSLDRLSRGGADSLLKIVREFDVIGVQVISLQESWTETSDPMMRSLVMSVVGWVAEHESIRRSERTKAGLEKARLQGKKLGRPKKLNNKMIQKELQDFMAQKKGVKIN